MRRSDRRQPSQSERFPVLVHVVALRRDHAHQKDEVPGSGARQHCPEAVTTCTRSVRFPEPVCEGVTMMVPRSADAKVERVPDGAGELGLLVVEEQTDG